MSAAASLLLMWIAAPGSPGEPVLRVDLLDNGAFSEAQAAAVDSRGVQPIPWWSSSKGMEQVVALPGGGFALRTKGDEQAEQPVAAFAPLARTWEVRGKAKGRGVLSVTDGAGLRVSTKTPGGEAFSEFRLRASEAMVPRFLLRLESDGENGEALWKDLSFEVDLPCPSEKDLRAEILALLREIVAPWLERGLDREGQLNTGLLCHTFDAITGERLSTLPGGMNPFWEQLDLALQAEEVPEWRAALERFLGDWQGLCLDPGTGLPRLWDTAKDEPIADRPSGDLALQLGFLVDVSEGGPERFRVRARAAAEKIGETVLTKGILPDGTIGASYFPSDGRVNTSIPEIRRFDVLAQLARLPKIRSDPRFLRASEELRSAFEFVNAWSGKWEQIDPGFDDEFGNYGACAAGIALADREGREGRAFGRLAQEGLRFFAPRWRDALRLGGNVAADQVRCWKLLGDLARVDPSTKEEIAGLLRLAVRSHFKGEQYGDGAWGDVTIVHFDPKTTLQVGDYPGAPQNLLNGLATIYSADLGSRRDEVRAMYTAVLRSSVQAYKRRYGFLLERSEHADHNPAVGTIRMLLGLVKMLRKL